MKAGGDTAMGVYWGVLVGHCSCVIHGVMVVGACALVHLFGGASSLRRGRWRENERVV